MQSEEWIPAGEFCAIHHVEISFISHLHSSGLIGMTVRDGAAFVAADELPVLEKLVRWHYELAINPEGIEALFHLLGRLEDLQAENRLLRSKLHGYQVWDTRPVHPGETS
jgi:hypothetical protein